MSLLLRPSVALASVALCLLPLDASAAAPSPKIQLRVDSLLKRRLKPDALPIDLPNPFQVITGTGGGLRDTPSEYISPRVETTEDGDSKSPSGPTAAAAPAASNIDILSSTVSRLKFGGIIILKDQTKIVINGVQRRENDMIPADWQNNVVYLKIIRLRPGEVVLRYGDAEATLKF